MKRLGGILLVAVLITATGTLPASAREPVDESGKIGEAPFRIQIPADWNRGLVVYAHGYLPPGAAWSPLHDVFTTIFLDRGFALAESGYSSQGWAFKEAIAETETLRRHFVEEYGEPDVTLIVGHSMGGLITLAAIENLPAIYDGALPMCGPLAPATLFFRDSIFDVLVTFEALFGEALPEEFSPVIETPYLPKDAVSAALEADSVLAGTFAVHWEIKREEVADIVTLYHLLYRDIRNRCGGNPIDNTNTVYSGFGAVEGLNRRISRYAADPAAFEYLKAYYTPTGFIEDPVIAVHTTYDPGVPPRWPNSYSMTVALTGNQEWFVQKWVEADGHCNIDPDLVAKAFDELLLWVKEGTHAEPGLVD